MPGGIGGPGRGALGPSEVGYVTLTAGIQPLTEELTGRVTAAMTSEVRPQVDGIVRRRLFAEGSTVRAGQPLYEIDARSYVAARDQVAAQLQNARASQLAAQARADRLRSLGPIEAVSKQDVDDAVAAAGQAAANVRQAQASLAAAQLRVEYSRVLAPISGYIGRSSVTAGALVNANQQTPLATIQQLDPVYVDVAQSSAQLLALRRRLAQGTVLASNAPARLKLEDGSDYPIVGRIEFTEVNVDPATGTVTLRARFANPNRLLLPGTFVRVQVVQASLPNAVMAPQQGIARDAKGGATALVLDRNNKVEQRAVIAERAVGDKWLVTSGLKAGDRLIVEGTSKVRPGAVAKPVAIKPGA